MDGATVTALVMSLLDVWVVDVVSGIGGRVEGRCIAEWVPSRREL